MRGDSERGASAVLVAIFMSLILIVVAAIAVDLGMQRVVRSDMQAVADVVALDTARHLQGKAVNSYTPDERSAIQSAFQKSLQANQDSLGELERYDWEFVRQREDTGRWEVLPRWSSAAVPDGVQVTVDGRVDFTFGRVAGIEQGGASRAAIATRSTPAVCVTVGTRALTLDTSTGGLSPLLDLILKVNLGAVGYDGIASLKNVTIPLADLLVELDIGTVEKLASTNISLLSFVVAVADVLEKNGALAEAALLRAIRVGVSGAGLRLADILALKAPDELAGLTADLNVLDILSAGIIAANGERAIGLEVPGLASLKVIEPPQVACGVPPVTAQSAQIRLTVNPAVPSGLTLGLVGAQVDLNVQVARGTATVSELACASPARAKLDVQTGLVSVLPPTPPAKGQITAQVGLDFILDILGPDRWWNVTRKLLEAVLNDLLGVGHIELAIALQAGVGTSTQQATVEFPEPPALPERIVVPEGGVGKTLDLRLAPDAVTITSTGLVGALGDLLSDVLSGLAPIVNVLLSTVDGLVTGILNTLSGLLGLKLGVAEVDVHGHPDCAGVRLVG